MADKATNTDRLEFYSDAVIAISATLLVIDIKVPRIEETAAQAILLNALLKQWSLYLSFVMSFIYIGIAWASHHNMFRYIKRSNHTLLLVNLLFLMCIAFVPFSSALLAEYIGKNGQQTAAFVYLGTLTATALSYNAIWWYATRNHHLIDKDTDPRLVKAMTKEYALSLPLHLIALVLAFFNVFLSLIPILLIYVFYALPSGKKRSITGGA